MIKKYWYWYALSATVIVIGLLSNALAKKDAENLGNIAKAKIESQLSAEQKTMLDWYARERAELISEREENKMQLALVGADAVKFHAQSVAKDKQIANLSTCNEQLQAKNALLVECQNYVLELNQNYQNGVEELGDLWGQKFALNLREIGELRLANNSLISRVGSLAKENVILKSTKRNRLNFAIFGGVDLVHRDFAAGVGLSFDLFPIKFRLF